MSVGSPAALLLDAWAFDVAEAFGEHCCYLVGSATAGKGWRDVDVVLMLDDARFVAMFGQPVPAMHLNRRWSVMCTAFSLWGERATGLPIDFKFQHTSTANDRHDGPREPLGLFPVNTQAP